MLRILYVHDMLIQYQLIIDASNNVNYAFNHCITTLIIITFPLFLGHHGCAHSKTCAFFGDTSTTVCTSSSTRNLLALATSLVFGQI